MDRGEDIPQGLEILDDTGAVIAAGAAAPPSEPQVPPVRPRWLIPAVAAGVVAVLAAVVITLVTGDDGDEGTDQLGEPIGIVTIDRIDLGPATAATYPLFGRTWTDDLVITSAGVVTVIDLDDGSTTVVDLRPFVGSGRFPFGTQATVVGGDLYVSKGDGIDRITGDTSVEVWRRDADPFSIGILVSGAYAESFLRTGGREVREIATGDRVDLDGVVRYAIAGETIFSQRGSWIRASRAGTEPAAWAEGEIIATGAGALAWRTCADGASCEYWLGDHDEPRRVALDPDVVERTIIAPAAILSTNFGGATSDLLSPTGRYAWVRLPGEQDFSPGPVQLVDLVTGAFTGAEVAPELTVFAPDERAIVATRGSRVTVLDTATGTTADIPTDGRQVTSVVFLPRR